MIMSFTDIGKSCPSREFLTSQICFNAIRENKILAKISGNHLLTVKRQHNIAPYIS